MYTYRSLDKVEPYRSLDKVEPYRSLDEVEPNVAVCGVCCKRNRKTVRYLGLEGLKGCSYPFPIHSNLITVIE